MYVWHLQARLPMHCDTISGDDDVSDQHTAAVAKR